MLTKGKLSLAILVSCLTASLVAAPVAFAQAQQAALTQQAQTPYEAQSNFTADWLQGTSVPADEAAELEGKCGIPCAAYYVWAVYGVPVTVSMAYWASVKFKGGTISGLVKVLRDYRIIR